MSAASQLRLRWYFIHYGLELVCNGSFPSILDPLKQRPLFRVYSESRAVQHNVFHNPPVFIFAATATDLTKGDCAH